jgi:hypothetical protein
VSTHLKAQYGRNFELRNLRRMMQFAEQFTDIETIIPLVLCAESRREQVELLEMHKHGIMVAEYWTELPPKKELEKRLHTILIEAKERIERKKMLD